MLSNGSFTYTYGLGNLSQTNGTATDYFLGDALGSTRQLADGSGAVGLAQSYDAFGDPAYAAGAGGSIFGYAGQQTDGSGLQYLRARYYAPDTGRFLSRDTFAGYVDLPQSLNPYVYGLNNPVLYSDPSGNFPSINTASVAGAINAAMQWVGGGASSPCGPSWEQIIIAGGVGLLASWMNFGTASKTDQPYWMNFLDGARDQFWDDMSVGLLGLLAGGDLRNNHTPGFQEGRDFGHRIAMMLAIAETAAGLIDLVITIPILLGTGIGAGACAAVTAGGCLVIGGVAITAELALAVAGGAAVLHGGAILATRMNMERSEGGGKPRLSDDAYEEAVRGKSGGSRQIIDGREIDSVTDNALIQAKNYSSAVENPGNFLSQDRRSQINETIRLAIGEGKRAEFWFPEEPHMLVKQYITSRGGTIVVWTP